MSLLKTKGLFLLASLFISASAWAQPTEELTPLSSRPQQNIPINTHHSEASLSLPFIDDFSGGQSYPDTNLWEDAYVYVNQTLGIAPPSLGVATFDGLDQYGWAYNLGSLATDTADRLTSRPIDLSNTQDTVYLSFFWQAAGLGEAPESTDSLSLEFYSPQADDWFWAWGQTGLDSTGFNQEMIAITAAPYLLDGFQFRFTSYGSGAGAMDVWNLDYVRLVDLSTQNDTLFSDISFTRPHPSLLNNFQAIPWFHYNTLTAGITNKTSLDSYYQRNVTNPQALINVNLCIYEILLGNTQLSTNPSVSNTKDDAHAYFVETYYNTPLEPFTLPAAPTGEFELTAYQTYQGPADPFSRNDTVHRTQVFKNYYALDDGSAERAYQVKDNNKGIIVTKYDLLGDDSIKGLYLYFLPSLYNAEDVEFSIVIFESVNGIPGNLIYETDSLYTPQYSASNSLIPYALDKPDGIFADEPIFVGIRQKSNVRLPIGFDMNYRNFSRTFFGVEGNLYESFLRGNLMMRPYLKYQPADLSTKPLTQLENTIEVFPNPATDFIRLNGLTENSGLHYSLHNLAGQQVQTAVASSTIRLLPEIKNGVYIFTLYHPNGAVAPSTQKLLIAH